MSRQLDDSEHKTQIVNGDVKNMSNSNKNLITELKCINNILDDVNKQREANLLELNYYKSELEITKKNLKDAYTRIRELDSIYSSMSKKLADYQNTVYHIH